MQVLYGIAFVSEACCVFDEASNLIYAVVNLSNNRPDDWYVKNKTMILN